MWKETIYIMVLALSLVINVAFALHLYFDSQNILTVIECNDLGIEGN